MTDDRRRATGKGQARAAEQPPVENRTASVIRHPSASGPPSSGAPPIAVSPHLLTWWFGLMAVGGMGFGLYAERRPFGPGIIAYPPVIFFVFTTMGLVTLSFVHQRPLTKLISVRCLVAGGVIAIACFLLGTWFGASLMGAP
jgi:hypothetical protein